MPTNILKSQKIIGSLGNLYIDDWKKNKRVKMGTLQLVSRDL